MSILIKGEKMPECCDECPCFRCDSLDGVHAYQCNVTLESYNRGVPGRPSKCPLVEVPEKHGDLIDTDRLLGVLGMSLLNAETCNAQEVHTVLMTLVMPLIASQPIIIEAEDKK